MRPACLLLLAVAGCASGFRDLRDQGGPGEYEAFTACYDFVAARACPPSGDAMQSSVYRSVCMEGAAKQMLGLPPGAPRRAYLVQAGCPEVVVTSALERPR